MVYLFVGWSGVMFANWLSVGWGGVMFANWFVSLFGVMFAIGFVCLLVGGYAIA